MTPELFTAFSNGNPLSCSTQSLIQPAINQATGLQTRLTTPEPVAGAPLTRMQLADATKRSRCIAALTAFVAAAEELDDYISRSLETVIDDLSLRKAAEVLDAHVGVNTGTVSAIVEGGQTATITAHTIKMATLDQAITDYESVVISKAVFESTLDAVSTQLESLTPSISNAINAETAEKARIVQQHKAMSSSLRAQTLMKDPATQEIMQNLGLG